MITLYNLESVWSSWGKWMSFHGLIIFRTVCLFSLACFCWLSKSFSLSHQHVCFVSCQYQPCRNQTSFKINGGKKKQNKHEIMSNCLILFKLQWNTAQMVWQAITGHHTHTLKHSFTPKGNFQSQSAHLDVLGCRRTQRKPKQTRGEHAQKLHTGSKTSSGSNHRPRSCVEAMPPTNKTKSPC